MYSRHIWALGTIHRLPFRLRAFCARTNQNKKPEHRKCGTLSDQIDPESRSRRSWVTASAVTKKTHSVALPLARLLRKPSYNASTLAHSSRRRPCLYSSAPRPYSLFATTNQTTIVLPG
jgi:hypothetical protein